ncbi:hypothetical protein [Mycobacterium sherrisii]|nr:hypothetical protein [Mycobacterium sherrisii]MCV7031950.1 hypothetical protein [Mycobacterium sherrisii]
MTSTTKLKGVDAHLLLMVAAVVALAAGCEVMVELAITVFFDRTRLRR